MMTREEAIKALRLERGIEINGNAVRVAEFLQGLDVAISVLRPVSREQVEKVWPGCEACKDASLAIGEIQLYGTFEGSIDVSGNMHYCPNCGRPITPVAKERQVERVEALKDGKGD